MRSTSCVKDPARPDDVPFLTATQLIAQYRAHRLSPVELLHATLDRVERFGNSVNAFACLNREGALEQARSSERRWRRNTPVGLLDGVILSVKDNLHVAGLPTQHGSKALTATIAAEDSSAVAAARRHGAIVLGKSTMPEFAVGAVTISPLTGITRNPWNLAMTAGGSSGGAAAAVAAGMGTLAIAGDAGGSIRIPASLCGVVGFKPTFGRVPAYPFTGVPFLSCVGPLARTVEDAALLMNVLAEPDWRDTQALPLERIDFLKALSTDLKGKRIAVSTTLGYARHVDDEVCFAVSAAEQRFADLGAVVERADPGFANSRSINQVLVATAMAQLYGPFTPEQMAIMSEPARATVELGLKVSGIDYVAAMDQRRLLSTKLREFHQRYDLLITPTVSVQAFPAELWAPETFDLAGDGRGWIPFTSAFNLTQQPAISIPCGISKTGLPIGLQIVGREREDALVLSAAHAFETTFDFSAATAQASARRPRVP
jgi:aspartyl-tRNA(Asn)/glutamyl-tRNA(Gln) amidotransferase subunit A